MFEIACGMTGLTEGRKPFESEAVAREAAMALSKERGQHFQLWDSVRLIDVIDAADAA